MRVIFMGTPEFAVPTLQALIRSDHQIPFVVSQPDRPQGRGYKVIATPVKEVAQQAGLVVLQPNKLGEVREQFIQAAPDAVVVVAFGQKIPTWLLDLPRWGCINLHPSLLPKYRGAAPIQAAIANGDTVTGVSTMRLDQGWDTGDILLQREVPIIPGETGGQLHDRLKEIGADLIMETLQGLEQGRIVPVKQDESAATYAPKLSREAAKIIWSRPAEAVVALVRANNPWPVAWTTVRGEMLKIWQAEVLSTDDEKAVPGTVIRSGQEGLVVQAGRGLVAVRVIQKAGGKPLDAADFVRGFHLPEGTILGVPALQT